VLTKLTIRVVAESSDTACSEVPMPILILVPRRNTTWRKWHLAPGRETNETS
jgi:hypothetical protein